MPTHVSIEPQILTLEKLISSKLSTFIGRGIDRSQDYADAVKLVEANHLPREYGVDPKIQVRQKNSWVDSGSGNLPSE
jgi:hypothetical protein